MGDAAWIVEKDNGIAEVVFSASADEAWTQIHDNACGECPGRDDCACHGHQEVERAPLFDQHSPGPVPMEAYRRAGWGWRCSECDDDVMPGDWRIVGGYGYCHRCADAVEADAAIKAREQSNG